MAFAVVATRNCFIARRPIQNFPFTRNELATLPGNRGAAGIFSKRAVRMAAGDAPGKGGNVIDRPNVLPGEEVKKQPKSRRPPPYKVLLHNDNTNRREYVVKVLLKVVDGMTVDDAVNVMQEAHINGLALVIACPQVDAENYCKGLRSNGLVATMEPDS